MYAKLPPGYIAKSSAIMFTGGTLFYGLIEYFSCNEAMPLLKFVLGPERMVRFNVYLAKYHLLPLFGSSYKEYPELKSTTLGLNFNNPLGLSSDFDKYAEAIKGIRKSGFGFIEVGTAVKSGKSQDDESSAIDALNNRIAKAFNDLSTVPLGVNPCHEKRSGEKNATCNLSDAMCAYSDYLTVTFNAQETAGNKFDKLSSDLKSVKQMLKVSDEIHMHRPKVLLKIPDNLEKTDIRMVAKLALDCSSGVDGIIIAESNDINKSNYYHDSVNHTHINQNEEQGTSTECVRMVYKLTHGKIPIISCGNISTGLNAFEKIKAGASLVQLNSSFLVEGFPVVGKIKRELVDLLKHEGFSTISQAIGSDHA